MNKMREYEAGRADGLDLALRIVRSGGLEALEREIKFRGITGINTSLAAKDLDKASEQIKKLEESEEAQEWVPVTERLPEDEGAYICTFDGELVEDDEPFVGADWFENGKFADAECVLAWMPLPKRYQEEIC